MDQQKRSYRSEMSGLPKWEAFGWDVIEECADGNNMAQLLASLADAKTRTGKGKPVMILMHTAMGKGSGLHGGHPSLAWRCAE